MPGLEKSLQRAVLRRLHSLPGAVARKRWGSARGVAGDPDIYLLWQGRHYEIELKRPGEEPTPLQRLRLGEWQAAGARIAVVHSVAELESFLAAD